MNKKILFAAGLFFSLFHSGFAQSTNQFSVDAKFGVLTGFTQELLYYRPATDGVLESRLDWQIQAPLLSLNIQKTLPNKLNLQGKADIAIPSNSGIMEDYDWLNYLYYKNTDLSRYSQHENHLNYYFDLSFNAGYEFTPCEKLKLIPYGSFDYNTIFFTAHDGYYQYAAADENGLQIWNEDITKQSFHGDVISYSQDLYEIGLGFKTIFQPDSVFTLEAYGSINYITHYMGFDFHIMRYKVFADEFFGDLKINYGGQTLIAINEKLAVGISFEGEYVFPEAGNSYSQGCNKWNGWDSDNWYLCSEQGGLTRQIFKFSLSSHITF